jgi:hypothetical protein
MRLFSHFGNSLAFILFVWSISFEPFNLIIVKALLYRVIQIGIRAPISFLF